MPASPEKVTLIFGNDRSPAVFDLPPHVSIDREAALALGFLPPSIQTEIIALVASDKNDARSVPNETGIFAAKTRTGYGVIYESCAGKKVIIQVITPSDLEWLRMRSK